MAKLKTTQTDASVSAYLDAIPDASRREQCRRLGTMMTELTGSPPKMWGTSIVGFGSYHYKYESGHEGDTCLLGFASRKDAITLYLCAGLEQLAAEFDGLGKYKLGKGCLYLKKLDDVDPARLRSLLAAVVRLHRAAHTVNP